MITGFLAIIHDTLTRSLRAPMGLLLLMGATLTVAIVASLGVSTTDPVPGGSPGTSRLTFVVWTLQQVPMGPAAFVPAVVASTASKILAGIICGWVGIIAAIVATSDYMTGATERGRVELTLSRPLPRSLLVLAEYFSGLAFVGVLASLVIGGSWLAFGIRLGHWDLGYLYCIPITVCLFALLNATAILAGILFRHWALSIMVPIGFWALCTMVATAKTGIDTIREASPDTLSATMVRAGQAVDILHSSLPSPGTFGDLNWAVIDGNLSLGPGMLSQISVSPWSLAVSAIWTAGCLVVACLVFNRREL